MTRVFVTGLGAVTPIGNDVASYWRNLVAGTPGASRIDAFDVADIPFDFACQVRDFDPELYMDRKTTRRTARSSQFAIAVTKQALADAGLTIDRSNWYDIGIFMATGGGGITEIEFATETMTEKGWRTVGPFVIPSAMANAVSCTVSLELGIRGPVMTSTAACASGHYSMLEGYHALRRGEIQACVAGGTESALSLLTMSAFGRMGALSSRREDPASACRPFSVDRDGFAPGEGAGAVILETEEHARNRGARIYAEVLGGRLTGDAYHITAPDPEGDGATRAMQGALQSAGLRPEDVDAIFAHGTGTALNDKTESLAIRRVFGTDLDHLRVTSLKSMVGHALGAAGAQSAIAAIKSIQTGVIPPTINYTPDPELGMPIVGNQAIEHPVRHAIVNAFGFGGQNVVVVFGKVDE